LSVASKLLSLIAQFRKIAPKRRIYLQFVGLIGARTLVEVLDAAVKKVAAVGVDPLEKVVVLEALMPPAD
jgi:hypothetical protein